MNKFQNDKRKALNREYARLYYYYQKTFHLIRSIQRIRSFKRLIKVTNQVADLFIQIQQCRFEIQLIISQPMPRFPSGGVSYEKGPEMVMLNLHKDSHRKPQKVAIIGSGMSTGKYWAQRMAYAYIGVDIARTGEDKSAFILHSKDGVHVAESIAEMLRNNRFKSE